MNNNEIFTYTDPIKYLVDIWKVKNSDNKKFTIRAWAKLLGMKNHGPLHEILRGKRKFPRHYIASLCDWLNLDNKESLYFETLIDYQLAKGDLQKSHYKNRLVFLGQKNKLATHELDNFTIFSDPIYFSLLEIVELKGFKYNLRWIQNKLCKKYSITEIRFCVEKLLSLNFLTFCNGQLTRVHNHVFTKNDHHNEAIRTYHKNVLSLACVALDTQKIEEREFNSVCFNIDLKNIYVAKQLIREFRENFLSQLEAPNGCGENIYQMNIQFFSLTN